MSDYATQIAAFTDQRAVKAAAQKSIMDDAAAKGETLDTQQQEDFDTLQGEIEAIDSHLKRLALMEKAAGALSQLRIGISWSGTMLGFVPTTIQSQ